MNVPVKSQLLEAGQNASTSLAIAVGRPVFGYPVNAEREDVWVGIADACLGFRGVALKDLAVKSIVADGKNDALCVGGPCLAYVVGDVSNGKVGACLAPYGGSSGAFYVSATPTGIRLMESNYADTTTSLKWIYIEPYALRSHLIWRNPALGATTDCHAAVTDNGAQQVVTTGITNPGVPRNVTATAGGTSGDVKAIQVIVAGTNIYDEVISETLPAFTVNTTGDVTGSKAFKTITSITIPAHDGTGATTAVGFGAKLGLPNRTNARKTAWAFINGTLEGTLPTLANSLTAYESNMATFNTALGGTQADAVFLER